MKNNHFLSLALGLFMPLFLLGQLDIRTEYISIYKDIAIEEMERVGVPASIKMAQALLESGAGTSTLAVKALNHFGIKCGNSWDGQTMYRKDDDYDDKGKLMASCFRKYSSVGASFRAHSQFLLDNRRYAFLFELDPTDYRGWAKGLKKAGYATSSTYANKLIQLIEEHELYLLDLGIYPDKNPVVYEEPEAPVETRPAPVVVSTKPTKVRRPAANSRLATISINDVKNVKARINDTPSKIAAITNVDVRRLIRYNEFLKDPNQQLKGGERVFLQPKRTSYRGRKRYHFVKEGESMFAISQLYGLRLKSLYEKNRLDPGHEPAVGAKIKLRGGKVKINQKPKSSWKGKQKPIVVEDFEWEKEEDITTIENGESFLPAIATKPHRPATATKPTIAPIKKPQTTAVTTIENETKPVDSSNEIVWDAPKKEIIKETPPPVVKETIVESIPEIKPVKVRTPKFHVVQAGETLYRISKNFGISVEELKVKNDLSSNTISIGQRLIVD